MGELQSSHRHRRPGWWLCACLAVSTLGCGSALHSNTLQALAPKMPRAYGPPKQGRVPLQAAIGDPNDEDRSGASLSSGLAVSGPESFQWVDEHLERQTYSYEVRLKKPLGMQLEEEMLPDSRGDKQIAVVVKGFTPDSNAVLAGVREGDRIVATSATWGDHMWSKSSLDGVIVAVSSRLKYADDVKLRLERPFDSAAELRARTAVSERVRVTLQKPLGLELEERPWRKSTAVFVKQVDGNVSASGKVLPGDRITAISASLGERMWPTRSVEGVRSAIMTRLGNEVCIELERAVNVGSDETPLEREAPAADLLDANAAAETGPASTPSKATAAADFEESLLPHTAREAATAAQAKVQSGPVVEAAWAAVRASLGEALAALSTAQSQALTTNGTEAVLMERATFVLIKCVRARQRERSSTNKGTEPEARPIDAASLANTTKAERLARIDQVVGLLLLANVVPSPKFVNMAMTAYRNEQSPEQAIHVYKSAVARGMLASLECVSTLIEAVSDERRNANSLRKRDKGWAGSRPALAELEARTQRHLQLAFSSLDAMQARGECADTHAMNALMRACVQFKLYDKANDIFWRLMRAGGASAAEEAARPCAPDTTSWNIMIYSYARQRRADLVESTFNEMRQRGEVAPDRFTYTEVVRLFLDLGDFDTAWQYLRLLEREHDLAIRRASPPANAEVDEDAEDLALEALLTEGPARPPASRLAPDAFLYNQFIRAYSRSLQWAEAEAVMTHMQDRGVSPDWYSFAYLVPGLIRAKHYNEALEKMVLMEEQGLKLDVVMFTNFITAHAKLKDNFGAINLLQKMKDQGLSPNVRTLTSIMHACLEANNPDLALAMCVELKTSSITPDGGIYTMIVRALGQKGEIRKAATLLASVQRDFLEGRSDTKPNKDTYNSLLKYAVQAEEWPIAMGTLSEILLRFTPNEPTYAALATVPNGSDPVLDYTPSESEFYVSAGDDLSDMRTTVSYRPQSPRSKFLFESIKRIQGVKSKVPIRIAGELYCTALELALSERSLEGEQAAIELIASRRSGDLRVRRDGASDALQIERKWEMRLGRSFLYTSVDWGDSQEFVFDEDSADQDFMLM